MNDIERAPEDLIAALQKYCGRIWASYDGGGGGWRVHSAEFGTAGPCGTEKDAYVLGARALLTTLTHQKRASELNLQHCTATDPAERERLTKRCEYATKILGDAQAALERFVGSQQANSAA